MQPIYDILFTVVDVGSIVPTTVYVSFQVNARVVPLSSNLIINLFPSTGVPIGALIVNAVSNAVTLYWSAAEISGVSDAVVAVETTRGFIRLPLIEVESIVTLTVLLPTTILEVLTTTFDPTDNDVVLATIVFTVEFPTANVGTTLLGANVLPEEFHTSIWPLDGGCCYINRNGSCCVG
jgi:hypothetical protein